MTNLGIGLGKPLAPAQVPKNSRTELQGLGEPGAMCLMERHGLALGSPQADGGGEPLRGSCLRLPYKDGAGRGQR